MSHASKTAVVKRFQYGALPYRLRAGSRRPQFMLITSHETQRWVIPKGWPKKGKSPQYSAAREAFEEAGVLGAVAKHSVGSFSYKKRLKNGGVVVCDVRVFLLEVRRQSKQWPEKQERIIKWLSAAQAAEKVDEPRLGAIIRRLARKYDGRNPIELSGDPTKSKYRASLERAKGIGDRMCPNHDLGVTSRAAGIRRARREASSR